MRKPVRRAALERLLLGALLTGGMASAGGPSALALEEVACAPAGAMELPAVPGGDAALAGLQPGAVPASQPGRCWMAAISLSILLPDAVATGPVVVVADDSGQAVAVAAADGVEAWAYRVADEGEGQVHGLAAGAGTVYVAGPDGLTALDATDGTRRWRHRVSSDGTLADASGAFWPIAHGDAVEVVEVTTKDDMAFERRLVALDAATGDVRWEAGLPASPGQPPSSDGAIVVLAPGDGSLLAFDAADGTPAWVVDAATLGAMPQTRPTIGAGLVVVGLADGSAVALDARDGAVAWRSPGQGTTIASVSMGDARASAGARVLVDTSTMLAALDAETGEPLWSAPIQASGPLFPMVSIPGVTDDAVVIGTTDAMDVASIVALDAASGHERWRVATDAYGAILSPLVAGGRVVVPVYDLAGGTGLLSLGSPG